MHACTVVMNVQIEYRYVHVRMYHFAHACIYLCIYSMYMLYICRYIYTRSILYSMSVAMCILLKAHNIMYT